MVGSAGHCAGGWTVRRLIVSVAQYEYVRGLLQSCDGPATLRCEHSCQGSRTTALGEHPQGIHQLAQHKAVVVVVYFEMLSIIIP